MEETEPIQIRQLPLDEGFNPEHPRFWSSVPHDNYFALAASILKDSGIPMEIVPSGDKTTVDLYTSVEGVRRLNAFGTHPFIEIFREIAVGEPDTELLTLNKINQMAVPFDIKTKLTYDYFFYVVIKRREKMKEMLTSGSLNDDEIDKHIDAIVRGSQMMAQVHDQYEVEGISQEDAAVLITQMLEETARSS